MRDENARVREKFELSLDGRQIASIVVGALVILGVVFVLGLNVGRQVATRQASAGRAGDLEALDRGPTAAVPPMDGASLTFHDRLVKQKPPAQPPVTAAVAAPTPTPTATSTGLHEAGHPERSDAASAAERSRGTPTPSSSVAAGSSTAGHPERSAAPGGAESRDAASAAERSRGTPTPTSTSAGSPAAPERGAAAGGAESKDFTIQIGATQERAEADRIAARYRSLRPRVEAADVQGKGRWYRVRVGSFDTREAAERYRRDVSRETGVAGYVTASR